MPTTSTADVLERAHAFPRLRYMGSKYQLLPHLERLFAELGGETAVDAFSGSGVVSYLLKAQGFAVTSNDFLVFPGMINRATGGTAARIGDIYGVMPQGLRRC